MAKAQFYNIDISINTRNAEKELRKLRRGAIKLNIRIFLINFSQWFSSLLRS
jgi:hypothetical protein